MAGHRFRQALNVVAAFEATDDAALAVCLRDLIDQLCQCFEVFGLQPERADWIGGVSVESRADQNQLWFAFGCRVTQQRFELSEVVLASGSKCHRQIELCSQSLSRARFVFLASARIER